MKNLVKRACDSCIGRKVRCNGAWPCETCKTSARRLQCTYDKPAQKRGPKIRRPFLQKQQPRANSIPKLSQEEPEASLHDRRENEPRLEQVIESLQIPLGYQQPKASLQLRDELSRIIYQYESQSYGVWPIIRADVLLQELSKPLSEEPSVYGLAMALCAATMTQLDLDPFVCCIGDQTVLVDGSYLSQECIRIREQYQFRENLDVCWMLASFFLHVSHAKMDKRNSALMFIQEALTSARLLRLDMHNNALQVSTAGTVVDNGEILFPLLWVTERGYSMHLGLTSSFSYNSPLQLMDPIAKNAHTVGMIALARLFVTFDRCINSHTTKESLVESDQLLQASMVSSESINETRRADLDITREWMRTMIWQNALSAGYLSFDSQATSLKFTFPVVIGRDLLTALSHFSSDDLLPLGRDQLLKCYEVTNTLADTLLLNSALIENSSFQFGPYDFLHGLCEKIKPFLQSDDNLDSILREKTAKTLSRAPSRFRSLSLPLPYTPVEEDTITQTSPIIS